MILRNSIVFLLALFACACNKTKQEGVLTLKSLEGQSVHIKKTTLGAVNPDAVIASYQAILSAIDDANVRKETMLRLADLEIEMQNYPESGDIDPTLPHSHDYSNAIELYLEFLKSYPDNPNNDHVLYQLAKAYELNGNLGSSVSTLKQLIDTYPLSIYADEANFRRGEIQFVLKSYPEAVASYNEIVAKGDKTYFYEKALYKQGWALHKSNRPNESLHSFTTLLDRKIGKENISDLSKLSQQLTPGDLELVDDTLRVISLIFSTLNDNNAVANYFSQNGGRDYEYMIYQHLGALYLTQERIKDAADTYYSFIYSHPLHNQAPFFEINAIDAYKQGKFVTLLLNAKEDFVNRYQPNSIYMASQTDENRKAILPYLKEYTSELAQYWHALAQKTKQQTDYYLAQHWYQIFLATFPDDPASPEMNFLLAELLFENGQYTAAAHEYEKTAYGYPDYSKGAEAGYAALLAYSEAEKGLGGEAQASMRQQTVASALHFSDRYPKDSHLPAVLAKTASELFDLGENTQAVEVAHRVIDMSSRKQTDLRQTAWTIIGQTAFAAADYKTAEEAYTQALKLNPGGGSSSSELQEHLAASIYKQGDKARADNELENAANQFLRVGKVVPTSAIRSTAEFDAATIYISLKQWDKAIPVLEKFRQSYPDNSLQSEVTDKLAISYQESGDIQKAAIEFEKIAATDPQEDAQRDALLRAASLYQKTGNTTSAIDTYKRFVKKYPQPIEQAMEVRNNIANIYLQIKDTENQKIWLKQIIQVDSAAGNARTNRTLFLAAQAAFELAKYDLELYQSIQLAAPLQKSLMQKKRAMETSLEAYKHVLDYNVAETTTASSYQIASIYADFSKALLNSQRPRGLSDTELEQYNILLEEQAYPFEEDAITAHEANTLRASQGTYDEWVKKSFQELAKLLPARYAKTEKSEDFISAIK